MASFPMSEREGMQSRLRISTARKDGHLPAQLTAQSGPVASTSFLAAIEGPLAAIFVCSSDNRKISAYPLLRFCIVLGPSCRPIFGRLINFQGLGVMGGMRTLLFYNCEEDL